MKNFNFRYYPQPQMPNEDELDKRIFKTSLIIPSIFVVFFILVEFISSSLDLSFVEFGIYPRTMEGLKGIITGPFIHSGPAHLINNSVAFMVLSTALFFFYRNLAYRVFFLTYLLSGIFLWVGGREAWHIGASGVIYGLAFFLFFSGILRHDTRLLTIALVVTFLYGSMFWGLLPIDPSISWDGHLSGAIAGVLLSLWFKEQGPPRQKFDWEEDDDDNDDDEAGTSDVEYYVDNEDCITENNDDCQKEISEKENAEKGNQQTYIQPDKKGYLTHEVSDSPLDENNLNNQNNIKTPSLFI